MVWRLHGGTLQPSFYECATAYDWSNLWWALARVRHRPVDALLLLARMAEGSTALENQAHGHQCQVILHALAVLGLCDRRLEGGLLRRLAELDAANMHALVTAV